MLIWVIAIVSLVGATMTTLVSKKLVQILQLSSYRVGGVVGWLKRTKFDYAIRYFALAFFGFASMLVFVACFSEAGWYAYLGLILYVLIGLYFCVAVNREKQKTPLKVTKRVVRLFSVDFLLNYGLSFLLVWLAEMRCCTLLSEPRRCFVRSHCSYRTSYFCPSRSLSGESLS